MTLKAMESYRTNYRQELIQAAQSGGSASLERLVRGRLLDDDGPPLTDEEQHSLFLGIIEEAYGRCDEQGQGRLVALFEGFLMDFNDLWLRGQRVEEAEVTLTIYGLQFFEKLTQYDIPFPMVVEMIVSSVMRHTGQLKERVSEPRHIPRSAFVNLVRRINLVILDPGSIQFDKFLEWQLELARRGTLSEIQYAAMILVTMAKGDPKSVTMDYLYKFFGNASLVDDEKIKRSLIQSTFLNISLALQPDNMKLLAKQAPEFVRKRYQIIAEGSPEISVEHEKNIVGRFINNLPMVMQLPSDGMKKLLDNLRNISIQQSEDEKWKLLKRQVKKTSKFSAFASPYRQMAA